MVVVVWEIVVIGGGSIDGGGGVGDGCYWWWWYGRLLLLLVVVVIVGVGDGVTLHILRVFCNSLEKPIPRGSWKRPRLLRRYSAAGDGSPEPQREDINLRKEGEPSHLPGR